MKVTDYVQACLPLLRLDGWIIYISESLINPSEASCARIKTIAGKREAILELSQYFYDADPEEQRIVVAHELIHVIVDSMETVLYNAAEHMGPVLFPFVSKCFRDAEEVAVDELSKVIAPLLPIEKLLP